MAPPEVPNSTNGDASTPQETIYQKLSRLAREHENRQVPNVNDGYTNEMEWAFNTLIDARDEIKMT